MAGDEGNRKGGVFGGMACDVGGCSRTTLGNGGGGVTADSAAVKAWLGMDENDMFSQSVSLLTNAETGKYAERLENAGGVAELRPGSE